MKVALCLYGVVGNKITKAGSNSSSAEILEMGYQKYKENILSKYDTDVFLHTWSTDFEQEILELYKPKAHVIEKQEVFDIPKHVKGDHAQQPNRRQNHYSRWRSTQKVLDLLFDSDEEYDYVLLSRFDLGLENPFVFENLSKDNIYVSNWIGVNYDNCRDIFDDGRGLFYLLEKADKTSGLSKYGRGYPFDGEGILDLWFLGSPQKIKVFQDLFDKIGEYMMPNRCPQAPFVSNHKLALYHIQQNNLLKDMKFITDPTSDHCLLRYKYFNAKK